MCGPQTQKVRKRGLMATQLTRLACDLVLHPALTTLLLQLIKDARTIPM